MSKNLQKSELSQDDKKKLVEDNVNLVRYIVLKKFNIPYKDSDEYVSDGFWGLIKAAETYNPAKGFKFSTYAGICITNEILMTMRKNKKQQNVYSLDEPIFTRDKDGSEISLDDLIPADTIKDFERIELKEEVERAINMILNCFNGITRLALLYNVSGMNQYEISSKIHTSQSYISRVLRRGQIKLKEYAYYSVSSDYEEVIKMTIPNEKFYEFSFSSGEVIKFNRIFANLLTQSTQNKLPSFKLVHRNNTVQLFLEAEPESFAFIAEIIQAIDNFNLSFKANKEEIEEECEAEDAEEVQATQEGKENNHSQAVNEEREEEANSSQEQGSDQQKDSCNFRKGTIAERIFTFIMSQETFKVSDISEKFPECSTQMIQYVLTRAKRDNVITAVKKGVYKINK